jgi:hypothetical protein
MLHSKKLWVIGCTTIARGWQAGTHNSHALHFYYLLYGGLFYFKEKMILFSAVKLKELFKKERKYPWQKPNSCPRCNTCRLRGHGFAAANFDGYQCSLLLKLYRCPDCGCVIRPRPKGYFYRFDFGIWM